MAHQSARRGTTSFASASSVASMSRLPDRTALHLARNSASSRARSSWACRCISAVTSLITMPTYRTSPSASRKGKNVHVIATRRPSVTLTWVSSRGSYQNGGVAITSPANAR